jgi:protein TonB
MERAQQRARLDTPGSAYEPPPPPTPPADTAKPIGDVAGWFNPDDYPAAAQRAGEEGRVRVTVASDPAGLPTGCSVASSSGFMSLDNGTCTIMMQKARFDRAPAGRKGVRFWTSPPIRWVLPE